MNKIEVVKASWESLESAAWDVYKLGSSASLDIRIFGAVGVWMHCNKTRELFRRTGRTSKDVDVVLGAGQGVRFAEVLRDRGWIEDKSLTALTEATRLRFERKTDGVRLDIYTDPLRFCQILELADRFAADSPTVPVIDLLLSKLQAVELRLDDYIDVTALLLAHDLGQGDSEEINVRRLAQVVGRSWRWHRAVGRAVEQVRHFVGEWGRLTTEERSCTLIRLEAFEHEAQAAPKTLAWRLRSMVGTRMPWFTAVSELDS